MTAKNLASGVNNLLKNENRDTVVEKYKRLIEKLKTNENPYSTARTAPTAHIAH